ncbi:MAG: hypothetical protein IRY92_01750 [Dactylosporangium sp.]|nr:hypothetical protein [Dactylosporangium sp.]
MIRIHGPAELEHPGEEPPRRPPPGQGGLVMLGLAVGMLLMSIQLWLLTLAFELYLSGKRGETVIAAVISGLVFVGGLVMLRLLDRRPRVKD